MTSNFKHQTIMYGFELGSATKLATVLGFATIKAALTWMDTQGTLSWIDVSTPPIKHYC